MGSTKNQRGDISTTGDDIILRSGDTYTLTLNAPSISSSSKTLTLPDATDTLVGKATTDSFTNKTLTDASNNISATLLTSGTIPDARVAASAVTQHVASIDHDSLLNFAANEHIDWTSTTAAFSTSGTLAAGAATLTSVNKLGITAPANSATLTIADGTTLTSSSSGTLDMNGGTLLLGSSVILSAGTHNVDFMTTGNSSVTLPTTGTLATLAGSETLSNKVLTSPTINSATMVTPALGTPSSGVLTSCTGLPISTGVSGLGTGVATFLATPSSANLAAAITDEVGTAGYVVFSASPALTGATSYDEIATPSTPSTGLNKLYFKSDARPYILDDAGTELGVLVTGDALNNPMTTQGDIIIGGASGAATRLALGGSTNQVLTHDGTDPEWGPVVVAGTWTPTITNGTNVASSSSVSGIYQQIGNVVFCTVRVTITPTAGSSTSTDIEISLPVSSNFSANTDAAGNGQENLSLQLGIVQANTSNNTAEYFYKATVAAGRAHFLVFSYVVA